MPVRLPPPLQLCVRQEHGQEKGRGSNEAGEEEDEQQPIKGNHQRPFAGSKTFLFYFFNL